MVSWLLDKNIRELTKNKKSLDDLQFLLYKNYANSDSGYSSFQVRQLLKEMTGQDFKQFWHDYVDGTEDIDFDGLLDFYGLKFKAKEDKKSKSSFNARYTDHNGMAKVSVLNNGGSAWQAGITSDDVLVAINGIQLSYGKIKERIEELKTDQTYNLHYFNQGILKQTQITPHKADPEKLVIIANDKATKKQKKAFKSWSHHNLKDLVEND